MGFLLTSYNSLPEQVEANKEKCKDLQTQIDNIDTHEIEEVKAQVQTNTQNISNLTQGLGVTNTALNAVTQDVNDLKPRVTNLETKTSNMSKSGVDTAFTESINVAKAINVGTNVNAEGVITGSVLVANNDNGEGRIYVDEDTNVTIAQALNSGIVITENNISEYAPQTKTYLHRISFKTVRSSGKEQAIFTITIQNENSDDLTFDDICDFLNNLGFTSENYLYNASGLYHEYSLTQPYTYHTITGVYVDYSLKRINFVSENNTYEGVTKYANAILSQTAIEL